MKKVLLALLGLLQGTLGSYWAVLGYCFAFPESEPGSKDYEEDITFVPFGYLMMLIWLVVMAAAIIKLRKKKSELVTFLAAWAVGTAALLIYIFYIR
ncbi:MAG: hypothetical protein J6O40_02915 [Ruminococcus sp.]|nr:hypothetical protein [Ruminococcus sp.]